MADYSINMDLGLKSFEIKFSEQKESVVIKFNPCDVDLINRLLDCEKIITEKTKSFEELETTEDGGLKQGEIIKALNTLNNAVKEAVDYAFGNKISDELFKYCAPLSLVNGEYFILQFFEKIIPVIKKIIEKETEKSAKKMNKYLDKYKK